MKFMTTTVHGSKPSTTKLGNLNVKREVEPWQVNFKPVNSHILKRSQTTDRKAKI